MTDATGVDSLAFYLAFLHPAWMLLSLAFALQTLRVGLRLRSARRLGLRQSAEDYGRHLRLAKVTMGMLVLGFGGGLLSVVMLRGWSIFTTTHGMVSVVTLALFVRTAVLGKRLEQGQLQQVESHGRWALLSVLAAAAAFGTGFVLLP